MEEKKYNHEYVMERLNTDKKRLDDHGNRIDQLEQDRTRLETKMENLIDRINTLISVGLGIVGLAGTTLLGFFIWYIQNR